MLVRQDDREPGLSLVIAWKIDCCLHEGQYLVLKTTHIHRDASFKEWVRMKSSVTDEEPYDRYLFAGTSLVCRGVGRN